MFKKTLLVSVVSLVLGFVGGYWFNSPDNVETLPKDSDSKVVIDSGRVKTITEKGTKSKFVPLEGKTEVNVKKDGTVTIVTKTRGLSLRPGLGIVHVPPHVRPSLDLKVAYWNRAGIVVGIPLHNKDWEKPYCGVSWQITGNTAGFVGTNTEKQIIFGLRVGF